MTYGCKVTLGGGNSRYRVCRVRLVPGSGVFFRAGRILMVAVMDERDKRPFSMAAIRSEEGIELHIGASVNLCRYSTVMESHSERARD